MNLKISWPVTSEGDTGEGLLPSSFPTIRMPCSRWDLLEKSSTYSDKQWKEAPANHRGRRLQPKPGTRAGKLGFRAGLGGIHTLSQSEGASVCGSGFHSSPQHGPGFFCAFYSCLLLT